MNDEYVDQLEEYFVMQISILWNFKKCLIMY